MDRMAGLAASWGIELGYFDVRGGRREAPPETLQRMIDSLSAGGAKPAAAVEPPRLQPTYQGDGRKCWLLAVQLYGVRSRRNWGHGDFTDLATLLELVAALGGGGVGVNPLHAQFYDRPGSGSPYAPNSRLFLNPLYIDVEAVDEFQSDGQWVAEIEHLRPTELVNYAEVGALKIKALRAAYRTFVESGSAVRRADFDAYREERGLALERFAAFELLRARYPGPWTQWADEWRVPHNEPLCRLREREGTEIRFHEFLQWNAERQLQRCRDMAVSQGMAIGLYLDTAIGVDGNGADAWMHQDTMLRGLSVGAPPDQFNPAGQDWGLTAYNPHGLVATAFDPFRQMLRATMRYAGAVRIDHVLGLMRLFLIPHEFGAANGTYLKMPFETMLSVVCEESRRWKCIVIGEDLGTVPEGFRDTLSSWGLWSYLVMLFERRHDGTFKRPDEYPERAIATLNTHDLPTYAGWISDHDLQTKREVGVDPGESDDERRYARHAFETAVKETVGEAISFGSVVAFLAATPARLVSIGIEDVLGLKDQINVPGTVTEHPNWRRRWPVTLEDLAGDQRLRGIAATLSRAGRGARPTS